MTKMVVYLQGLDIQPDSFIAKPKTLYRAGIQYCRIEEQPDPALGSHELIVVNEPDVWTVDLAAKTATHSRDKGPTLNCRLPIFPGILPMIPTEEIQRINDLEFGHEVEFFRSRGATASSGPVLEKKQTIAYMLPVGVSTLGLFTYGTPERPLAVAWTRGSKRVVFWYNEYSVMDFDPSLFAKPGQVQIEEAK